VLSVAGEEGLTTVCVHVQVSCAPNSVWWEMRVAWCSPGVYVAVQVGNDDALAFYASLGFVEVQVIPRYYPPRVQPRDCVLMEHRPLGHR
jgi:hypothetical protein